MEMYDALSTDYDRFVNWPARLALELPFIERLLQGLGRPGGRAPEVLDAACGTGMHAIALAQAGYCVSGADLSAGMVAQAGENARQAGAAVRFEQAGFGRLADTFGRGSHDALLCLGNSLPHVLELDGLNQAVLDFAACLRPGGLLLIQNRNFDAVLARHERWMEPQAQREGEAEWLFLRFYDFDPDGRLSFHVVTLKRAGEGAWTQQVATTRLYPLREVEMSRVLAAAGFGAVKLYGDMTGKPFEPGSSGNLVAVARKR
jgi:SAM-dependent methyltransferase